MALPTGGAVTDKTSFSLTLGLSHLISPKIQKSIKMENKRCLNTIAEDESTGFKKQMEEI